MKPPRPKIHLLDVSEPLLAFHGLVMRCGETLETAEICFTVTEDWLADMAVRTLDTCQTCLGIKPISVEPENGKQRTYLYGLSEKPKISKNELDGA